jgi:hypothetical protein
MTIYAKSWCPAYPCDPCLVRPPVTVDNIGSGAQNAVYNYHEGDTTDFLGVRKFGLIIDTVAGSFGLPETDPPQFCIGVNGKTASAGGTPVPLGALIMTYGGSTVFTVSGPIIVMTYATSPGADGLYGFTGYVAVPADNIIHLGEGAAAWEWHYDGAFQTGPVSLQWNVAVSGSSSSNYQPETGGLTFYRTSCQEMPLLLTRQRRRVRLVGQYV